MSGLHYPDCFYGVDGNLADSQKPTGAYRSTGGQRVQVLPLVLSDLHKRIAKGTKDYGEPLSTYNGRNALWDAYEEALDMCLYLRQAIEERDPKAMHDDKLAADVAWDAKRHPAGIGDVPHEVVRYSATDGFVTIDVRAPHVINAETLRVEDRL